MGIAETMKGLFLSTKTICFQLWGVVGVLMGVLMPPYPSNTPQSTLPIDLESQLPETSPQPSLTTNQETPHSSPTVIELPPRQMQPGDSAAINPQLMKLVVNVNQMTLEWPNIIIAFCFEAAIQIALQHEETQQHSKLPLSFSLRSFSILLTFATLFVSRLVYEKFPALSKKLEKAAIALAVATFFLTIATPLTRSL